MARTKKALPADKPTTKTVISKTVTKSKRRSASVDQEASVPIFGLREVHNKKRVSTSRRANLTLPCSRVLRTLRERNYGHYRIQRGSSIYCTAVLEYLVAEVIELAGTAAKQHKKKRITPRHLCLAIRKDEELNVLLKYVTISQGGVLPNIHVTLLPKRSAKKRSADVLSSEENMAPPKAKRAKKP